jgi:hypothetical protein
MSRSILTVDHDPARLCLRCGEDHVDLATHRCSSAFVPAPGQVMHLTESDDREESSSFCTGGYESLSTWHPEAATCLACLDAAADAAEELLARVRSRRTVLREGGAP